MLIEFSHGVIKKNPQPMKCEPNSIKLRCAKKSTILLASIERSDILSKISNVI